MDCYIWFVLTVLYLEGPIWDSLLCRIDILYFTIKGRVSWGASILPISFVAWSTNVMHGKWSTVIRLPLCPTSDMDESLSSLYAGADRLRRQLDDGLERDEYQVAPICERLCWRQKRIQECISLFKQCKDLVERLALFSPNESIDDVASSELKYSWFNYANQDTFWSIITSVTWQRNASQASTKDSSSSNKLRQSLISTSLILEILHRLPIAPWIILNTACRTEKGSDCCRNTGRQNIRI